MHSSWTKEYEEMLRKWLQIDGLNSTQIVENFRKIGFKTSRNSVIGKYGRMGLKPQKNRKPIQIKKKVDIMKLPKPDKNILTASFNGTGKKTLENLERGECAWPLEGSYCGDPVYGEQSYCYSHCEKGFAGRGWIIR